MPEPRLLGSRRTRYRIASRLALVLAWVLAAEAIVHAIVHWRAVGLFLLMSVAALMALNAHYWCADEAEAEDMDASGSVDLIDHVDVTLDSTLLDWCEQHVVAVTTRDRHGVETVHELVLSRDDESFREWLTALATTHDRPVAR